MSWLDVDLRQTDFHSVADDTRPSREVGPNHLPRAGICFAGIHDWSQTNAFDPTSIQPHWDHYIVYYATLQEPYGKLYRTILQPPAAEISGLPYDEFLAAGVPNPFLSENPDSNPSVQKRYELLSNNVKSFYMQTSNVISGLNFDIILQDTARRIEPSLDSKLSFEMHFDITPENTKPRR